MPTPTISLVIACVDEGPDLEATIALARASDPAPDQIIVVDDWSTEPLSPRLSLWSDVEVVRPPERLGAGPAKAYGGHRATGDLIVLMDAHLRFSQDWLRIILDAHSRYPMAIMCPSSVGFDQDSKFHGAGARFNRRGPIGLSLEWMSSRDSDLVDLVPAILGGCYIIPRDIWSVLGGLNPNLTGWGYEEQDLSLRAWACGYEARCINGLRVAHNYRRSHLTSNRSEMATWHATYNAMLVAATVFEDGVFEKHFRPFVRFTEPNHAARAFEEFESRKDAIEDFRNVFQSQRRFNDSELLALVGYAFPDGFTTMAAKDPDADRKRISKKVKQDRAEEIQRQDDEIRARIDGGECIPCGGRNAPPLDPSKLPEV